MWKPDLCAVHSAIADGFDECEWSMVSWIECY